MGLHFTKIVGEEEILHKCSTKLKVVNLFFHNIMSRKIVLKLLKKI